MHKAPFVFPVIGGRKVSQLKANVEALSVSLTPEHILFLESAVPFDRGFPYSMIVRSAGSRPPSQNSLFPRATAAVCQ